MRNRILFLTRSSIPYVKELLPLAHSMAGCILMQQLDYWFERKSNGFYKFLEPCPNPLYQTGQSWVEELGISAVEFRTTFERFGTRYKSKSEFDRATDKFQGKFYCSYHDKRTQLTWYFRNHELMDTALDNLLTVQNPPDSAQNGGQMGGVKTNFPINAPSPLPVSTPNAVTVNLDNAFLVTKDTVFTGNTACNALINTQSTAMVTPSKEFHGTDTDVVLDSHMTNIIELAKQQISNTETSTDFHRPLPQMDALKDLDTSSRSSIELVFPSKTTKQERAVLEDLLAGCAHTSRQAVLDELEGYNRAGKIMAGMVPLARSLVRAVGDGKFFPNFGLSVLAARESQQRNTEMLAMIKAQQDSISIEKMNEQGLAMLPPTLRRLAEASVKNDPPPLLAT